MSTLTLLTAVVYFPPDVLSLTPIFRLPNGAFCSFLLSFWYHFPAQPSFVSLPHHRLPCRPSPEARHEMIRVFFVFFVFLNDDCLQEPHLSTSAYSYDEIALIHTRFRNHTWCKMIFTRESVLAFMLI